MVRAESKYQIDAYTVTMPTTPARPCAHGHGMTSSRLDISTPFNILIECDATEYSIRYSIPIRNFEDILFDLKEIPHSFHPYAATAAATGGCDPALTSQVKVYPKALRALPNCTAGSA